MPTLKTYDAVVNGHQTTLKLTAEQAERQGLSETKPPAKRTRAAQGGTKGAKPPANTGGKTPPNKAGKPGADKTGGEDDSTETGEGQAEGGSAETGQD